MEEVIQQEQKRCVITEFQQEQKKRMRAVQDSMDVLNGKWKISIISSICCFGKRRFSDILNDIEGISNRMLSKELKELELNQLVKRTVLDTQPITVQYELTEHGNTLQTIISNLTDWGIFHREKIVGK
ncbi:winged helix-turn-helix transcriptional regulator [Mucilaginibacter sp.]